MYSINPLIMTFVKGHAAYWQGKHHSEETKAKIRRARALQVTTEETREKFRKRMTGAANHNWKGGQPRCLMCGKTVSYNAKKQLCIRCLGLTRRGANSVLWRGGANEVNCQVRKSEVYRRWRNAVFSRDNYTCQVCSHRNTVGSRRNLHAHHIQPFSTHPDLRFRISNGQTMCVPCHRKTETYGVKLSKQKLKNGVNSAKIQNG